MPRLFSDSQFTPRRRKLRSRPSPAEKKLWEYLRKRGLNNFKFRRQHSVGYFVVDFFCPRAMLVVEVDGDSHLTPEGIQKDRQRDAWLRDHGLQVIHLTNQEVLWDTERVLVKISRALHP